MGRGSMRPGFRTICRNGTTSEAPVLRSENRQAILKIFASLEVQISPVKAIFLRQISAQPLYLHNGVEA